MNLNRRQFIILTAATAAGCQADGTNSPNASIPERTVDAGPISAYSADGIYTGFRDEGFFVVRDGEKLLALSSVCTHRACKLNAAPGRSFYCKCHGSTFNEAGKVTKGPAKRDLPIFVAHTTDQGHLLVDVRAT